MFVSTLFVFVLSLFVCVFVSSFRFPPPTMVSPDRADETLTAELQIAAIEGREILEYESHLAAASTGQTITEANSLLLTQVNKAIDGHLLTQRAHHIPLTQTFSTVTDLRHSFELTVVFSFC